MRFAAALHAGDGKSASSKVLQYWRLAGRAMRMVIVSIGHSPTNVARVRALIARAAQIDMALDQQLWGKEMSQDECRTQIKQLNESVDVYAVLLLADAPAHIDVLNLRSELQRHKDLIRPGAWHYPGPVRPGEVDCVLNSAIAAHQTQRNALDNGDAQIAR
ncbi:tetrahydrofolate dehydrogenase/cyclohydrolase catalytic domain-containing protein [Ruegeria conchae]|uniref:tetrahydrofolate dehydrogenase/cyclohydrolase catalytic domain-containing protein n=1 Tax=Ruegeria conchae TaxID=981384 RepID=UPI0015FFA71C|nr:tetrahydrofolate dehydrogenase/cyclohydrolase catalytic domain-containing protein [Ruegeria conchae]